MSFPLTDEQQFAVDTLSINCIVPAGAGSGKTRVLVERYLKIIEENKEQLNMLDRIVAITFTDKAAKEMKERVRKGMNDRRKKAIEEGHEDLAYFWREKLQKLERASISTIHSFCGRVLREFPVEANIDPEFKIVDEIEANWILMDTIERVLKGVLKDEDQEFSLMYQWVINAGFDRTLKQLKSLYSQIKNSGLDFIKIKELTENQFQKSPYYFIPDIEWEELIKAHDELALGESSSQRFIDFQNQWPMIKAELITKRENGEPMVELITKLVEMTKGKLGNQIGDLRKQANDLAKQFQDKEEAIQYHAIEKEYISVLLPIIEQIDRLYKVEKMKINAVDFDELQLRTIQLLAENNEVREAISNQISYLMIDEFQDNNNLQKQLISLLLKNDNGYIQPGALFIVGDPKQSIYRFRGAEVNVFKKMEQEIQSISGRIAPLQYNFRSDPGIINFVNAFFQKIMSDSPDSPNYYKEAIAKRESSNLNDLPVEFIPIQLNEDDEETLREKEALHIANRVKELLQAGVQPKEITLLFRSMSDIKVYEHALAAKNLPYYVMGGKGFYQKQEIQDLLQVLRYLLDPTNNIALTGILRSPLVGVTDDTLYLYIKEQLSGVSEPERIKINLFGQWIEMMKRLVGRRKISDLLQVAIDLTHYDAILFALPNGEQKVANVEKFIRLAKDFPVENPFSLYEFLQRIDRLIEEEANETEAAIESEAGNTIKLMTIHKSKGLEFPYVFLPDLSRAPVNDHSLIRFNPRLGLTCKLPKEGDWKVPIRWLYVNQEEKRLEREESIRVFYVATTRAEKKLILSGKLDKVKEGTTLEDVLNVNTWNKWLDLVLNFDNIDYQAGHWEYQLQNGQSGYINIWQKNLKEENLFNLQKNNQLLSLSTNLILDHVDDRKIISLPNINNSLSVDHDYSVSAIKRYQFCPRYYYYFDRLSLSLHFGWLNHEEKEELVEKEIESSKLTAGLKGTLVHQLLEQLTLEPEKITNWKKELQFILHANGIDDQSIPQNEYNQLVVEMDHFVKNFSESPYGKSNAQYDVFTEYDFTLSLQNGRIIGTIDRLEINNSDHTFLIVDYKTDKVVVLEKYRVQLYTYALAIQKMLKLRPHKGVLFFLRHHQFTEIPLDDLILKAWELELEDLLSEINAKMTKVDFTKNKLNCHYCIYQKLCLNEMD